MPMSYDVMRQVVLNGSNLRIESPVSYELLLELVSIAATTGSHITFLGNISYDLVIQLTQIGKANVTVVNPAN